MNIDQPLATGTLLENRYRIRALLGQGGMSRVYLADALRLEMPVAIKENLQDTPEARKQFENEARLLARLSHQNIPRVLDSFTDTQTHRQYLVMEYIEGEDLAAMIKRVGPLQEAMTVAWIRQILDAVEYLHAQNPPVIHRDIKPANIKITPQGKAVLVDFGISKFYDPSRGTMTGMPAVTAGYAPPEQYGFRTTQRSDIYALGATLYTMLTGKVPPDAPLRQAGEEPLVPPGQLVSVSGQTEGTILRALEVENTRRWQSVSDLRAALEGKATTSSVAEESKTVYVSRQGTSAKPKASACSSSRAIFVAASIFAIGILCIFAIAISGLVETRLVALAPMATSSAIAVEKATVSATATATIMATVPPVRTATTTNTPLPTFTPTPRLPVRTGTRVPLPNVAISNENLNRLTQLAVWGRGTPDGLAWTSDKKFLVVAAAQGIHIYNPQIVSEIHFIPSDGNVYDVALSPEDRILASAHRDKMISLWQVGTWNEIRTMQGHTGAVLSVAFSPDGRTIASGSTDTTVKLWESSTGRELGTLSGHTESVNRVAFSPDGKFLASASSDGTSKVWDVSTGREITTLKEHAGKSVRSVSFSPNGKTLASSSEDKSVLLWKVSDWSSYCRLDVGEGFAASLAFSADSRFVVGDSAELARVWEVSGCRLAQTIAGPAGHIVTFSPDGNLTIAEQNSGDIRFIRTSDWTTIRTITWDGGGLIRQAALSSDAKLLATAMGDKTIRLLNSDRGLEVRSLSGHADTIRTIGFSLEGKFLASGSYDKSVKLWDIVSGNEYRTLTGHTDYVVSVAFSPDGKILASGSRDATIKLWNVAIGTEIRSLRGHENTVLWVAFSPDGKMLASGSYDKMIKLWDVATGRELRSLVGHTDTVSSIAFSPDGKILASGGYDKSVKLWDVAAGREVRTIIGISHSINSVSFSPDGKILVSGADYGMIKFWDVVTGRELYSISANVGYIGTVIFSSDQTTLLSRSGNGTIQLWGIR